MAYQHKENRGTLWPNRYKKPGDNKPEWKGQVNVKGVVIDLAGWDGNINGTDVINVIVSDPADRPQRSVSEQYPEQSTVQGQLDQQPAFDRTRQEQDAQFAQGKPPAVDDTDEIPF